MAALLTALLFLHGAIHLLGFLKWSGLAAVPQLTGRTLVSMSTGASRAFAVAWLLACLAFLAAAALRLAHHEGWWLSALGGVALSQGLIVLAWHDAKVGAVANVLILVPAVLAAAHARFVRTVDDEVRSMLADTAAEAPAVVVAGELDALPPPVRRWLQRSGVVGQPRATIVRLRQRGALRTSPEATWVPATAEQWFTVPVPAFIWRVDAAWRGLVPFAGRDRYADGAGHMLIRAGSLLTVVDAGDGKIAHGALLRFLGEMVWFPSGALEPYVSWQPLDETSAMATMRHRDLVVSAAFTFDEEGRVRSLQADRYLGGGNDAALTPWRVTCDDWRRFHGIEVPSRGDVAWLLEDGPFSYYRWEIVELEHDGKARLETGPKLAAWL